MSKNKKRKQKQRIQTALVVEKAKIARNNARGKKITKASPQPPKGTRISKSDGLTLFKANRAKGDAKKLRDKRSDSKKKSLAKKRSHVKKMAKRML